MTSSSHHRKVERWRAFGWTATVLCALFAVLLAAQSAFAEPYRPERADTVLLRLKATSGPARAGLTLTQTLDAARDAMARGRRDFDDRQFGRAEALLIQALPCLEQGSKQCAARADAREGLLVFADLKQHGHEFEQAERTLDAILERDEAHSRVRLMRASIRLATGRPRDALTDCTKLAIGADSFVATACIAHAISLMGRLDEAVSLLAGVLERSEGNDAVRDERSAWALAILAELVERQGAADRAIALLERAVAADPDNLAARIQTIDTLLRHGGAWRAQELLSAMPDAEPVLLRRALAAKQLRATRADTLRDAWVARVAAEDALGPTAHGRDRALGVLHLMNLPEEALRYALANWAQSREIDDARVLIQAASAAGRIEAAKPALAWLDEHRIEDAVIDVVRPKVSL